MAEDAIALLDHVGWTGKRELHIVGISLGGMIAQGKISEEYLNHNMTLHIQNSRPGYQIELRPLFSP